MNPWDIIRGLPQYIASWLIQRETVTSPVADIGRNLFREGEDKVDTLYVRERICLEREIFLKNKGLGIFIGARTILEPTVFIKSPAVIGNACEIRHGAYLRGNVLIGNCSVIGHTTEVKNSVFMAHSEAGHFAYIGDSVIGNYVNLGAGTKLANLEFRTLDDKKAGKKRNIKIKFGGDVINTEMKKLGAFIGDGCELGCNSVTSPGVVLGQNSKVYPNSTVKKGIYPQESIIRS